MLLKDLIVSPCNVRDHKAVDLEIDELKASIKTHTLISRIILRPSKDNKFEIIAGYRRYKALVELLGEDKELPEEYYILMKDLNDEQAYLLSIMENQQRLSLSPLELNRAALKLNSIGYEDKKIAKILNVTPHRLKRLMTLSQSLARLPDKAKQELNKPIENSKFHDGHIDKMKNLEDREVIKDVVDYIIDKECPPREVPTVIKAIEKQHGVDEPDKLKETFKKAGGEALPVEGPIEYVHKGELKLEIHGDDKVLKVVGKGSDNEDETVPVEHYLEYLMHPEKFRCYVTFKLKVKPTD